MFKTILNLLWLVLGGLPMALGWWLVGTCLCHQHRGAAMEPIMLCDWEIRTLAFWF